jgi:hypothetical protein
LTFDFRKAALVCQLLTCHPPTSDKIFDTIQAIEAVKRLISQLIEAKACSVLLLENNPPTATFSLQNDLLLPWNPGK